MIPLRRHRAEHDQFPLVADFVEPEDVHAIVIRSDFDVPIAGSVPQSVWLLPIDAAHSHLARNLEALLTYVRKSNRRGDRRPPHESLSAPPKK